MVVHQYHADANAVIAREALGRIQELSVNEITVAQYRYIGGQVAQRVYPGPEVTYRPTYNNLGQATRLRTHIDSTDVVNFAYAYDPNGNITYKQYDHRSGDPCAAYTHDDLDRLTRADYGIQSENEQFSMDDIGNRSSVVLRDTRTQTYVVDPCTNAYTSVGGNSLTHDDSGNRTQDQDGYRYECVEWAKLSSHSLRPKTE